MGGGPGIDAISHGVMQGLNQLLPSKGSNYDDYSGSASVVLVSR